MAGKGMLWLAGADLVLASISAIGLFLTGKRLLPSIQPSSHALDREDVKLFFRKGLAFLMEPVRRSIYLEGTLVVTRIFLGPEAVAILATLRTLANSVAQLYNSVQASIFPELQRAMAENNYPRARRIFRLAMGATLTLTLAGLTGLGLFGPWIYARWTANMLQPPDHAWLLLLAGIAANAAWWPAASAFRAVNRPERYAVVGVLSALLGVALAAALVRPMGLNGALTGLLVMEVLMAIYVLPASCRLLQQPLRQLPADIFALRHDAQVLLRRGLLLAKAGQPFH
jgi:O-antigen/teichoic acid export membrane protein